MASVSETATRFEWWESHIEMFHKGVECAEAVEAEINEVFAQLVRCKELEKVFPEVFPGLSVEVLNALDCAQEVPEAEGVVSESRISLDSVLGKLERLLSEDWAHWQTSLMVYGKAAKLLSHAAGSDVTVHDLIMAKTVQGEASYKHTIRASLQRREELVTRWEKLSGSEEAYPFALQLINQAPAECPLSIQFQAMKLVADQNLEMGGFVKRMLLMNCQRLIESQSEKWEQKMLWLKAALQARSESSSE